MKIYVIGSFRDPQAVEQRIAFEQACHQLGAEIARRRHKIILCSVTPGTADLPILKGASEVDNEVQIWIYRPDRETLKNEPDSDPTVYTSSNECSNITFHWVECEGGWRVVHLKAIRDSDVILSIGGNPRGTGTAVYSAEVLNKPVVVLPSFGGASEIAWRDLKRYYSPEQQLTLSSPWDQTSQWAKQIIGVVEHLKNRNPFQEVNAFRLVSKIVLGLVAFLGWFWLFWELPPVPPWLAVVFLLFCASLAGTLLRDTLRVLGVLRPEWRITSIGHEALLGLMLAFAIFIVPQSAGILLNDEPAKLDTINDVRRVSAVLSPLSFASALFLEQAWGRLKEILQVLQGD
jgi:hypothetical protein